MITKRTLDRLPEFDVRSLSFPIRTLVVGKTPRSYTWNGAPHLDQGSEGACVGFGWAHEAGARPVVRAVTEADARSIYLRAQQLDEWDGEFYSGTSVLAGAKSVQERGWLKEYRWSFSLDDLVLAVGYKGPAVLGLNWYEGMFSPDSTGFIRPTGSVLGGHCLLVKGVSIPGKFFKLHNSWGPSWGVGGDAYISFEDLARLLGENGDACVPVVR